MVFFKVNRFVLFFLLLGWVYQPERVQAGIYLLFYTLWASLPLLFGILFIYNFLVSLCLYLLCGNSSLFDGLFYLSMFFAFLVRILMYIVHLWLYRVHVEAAFSSSIVLAGVVLKLGGIMVFFVSFLCCLNLDLILMLFGLFEFSWWCFC
jgi:NADH-ubiquinone oxidoreductase chain 4